MLYLPFNTLFQVEEAARYGIKVTKNEITDHFGQAYRKQQLKAPFYGIKQGMTPQEWWKEVRIQSNHENKKRCIKIEKLVYATFSSAGVHPKGNSAYIPLMQQGCKCVYDRIGFKL